MRVVFETEDLKQLPVKSDPEILGGRLCFDGTRVPVDALFGNLAEGASLDDFLEWFPTVAREQAEAVLRHAYRTLAAVE